MSEQAEIYKARETAFAMGILVLVPLVSMMAYLGVSYPGGFDTWAHDNPFWRGVTLIVWAGWASFVYGRTVMRYRPKPDAGDQ